MSNGKGSKPRPLSVSNREYADNWEKAFKKKPKITPIKKNEKRNKI